MENKGSTSVRPTAKSNLSSSNRKSRGVSSHQEKAESGSKPVCEKEDSFYSAKMDSERKKNDVTRKRPSTVSGNSRRRSNGEGSENSKGKNNKSWDRGSTGSNAVANFSTKGGKQVKPKCTTRSKTPIKPNKADLTESPGSYSLLSLALEAQQQTTTTMRLLRNALRKKAEEVQAKLKAERESAEADTDVAKSLSTPDPSACFFENSYASCLDEIFQAWINLLYLITNLKVTLHRVVMASGTERFKPDLQSEKAVITQATECVKFFSKLKLKSLLEGFEEINLTQDPKMKNFQILDFEERISSSFFSELETLSKKAKEMMDQLKKKDTQTEVN